MEQGLNAVRVNLFSWGCLLGGGLQAPNLSCLDPENSRARSYPGGGTLPWHGDCGALLLTPAPRAAGWAAGLLMGCADAQGEIEGDPSASSGLRRSHTVRIIIV